jgi:hypothetical protein
MNQIMRKQRAANIFVVRPCINDVVSVAWRLQFTSLSDTHPVTQGFVPRAKENITRTRQEGMMPWASQRVRARFVATMSSLGLDGN